MDRKLEVSFNSPQCGWMSIGFADGVNEFHTTTAHAPHGSAMPELMQILTEIADPVPQKNEFLLKWNRDPEEFDFLFIREGNTVGIGIYQYPTEERETSERELVFSHRGPVPDVLAAFVQTFEQLYADHKTDEFEFNWRQPFPFDEYEKLRQKIGRG